MSPVPDPGLLVGSSENLPFSPTLMGGTPVTSAPLPLSSQAFLTKVWWGKMCVDNGLWRVIACMLFFPLLYTSLITFRYFLQLGHGCTKAEFSSSLPCGWLEEAAVALPGAAVYFHPCSPQGEEAAACGLPDASPSLLHSTCRHIPHEHPLLFHFPPALRLRPNG